MKPSAIMNVFPAWLGNLLPKYETKPRPKQALDGIRALATYLSPR